MRSLYNAFIPYLLVSLGFSSVRVESGKSSLLFWFPSLARIPAFAYVWHCSALDHMSW